MQHLAGTKFRLTATLVLISFMHCISISFVKCCKLSEFCLPFSEVRQYEYKSALM